MTDKPQDRAEAALKRLVEAAEEVITLSYDVDEGCVCERCTAWLGLKKAIAAAKE